jgi:hypothetical protein
LVPIVCAIVLLAPPWGAWMVGKHWLQSRDDA